MLDRSNHLASLPRPLSYDGADLAPDADTGAEAVCTEPIADEGAERADPPPRAPDVATVRAQDSARYQHLAPRVPSDPITAAARSVASIDMPRDRSSSTSHVITLATEVEAKTVFGRAVDQLLDVSNWDGAATSGLSDFELYSESGQRAAGRAAAASDFIRIDLPGNPIDAWVRVESLDVTPDRVSMRVRPSYDPTERPLRTNVVAHFFGPETTNTFTLERHGRSLRLAVEGRNETPNVGSSSGGYARPIVNRATTIGAFGAMGSGLQHHQWDHWTRELLVRAR